MLCFTDMHTVAYLRRREIGLVLQSDAVSAMFHLSCKAVCVLPKCTVVWEVNVATLIRNNLTWLFTCNIFFDLCPSANGLHYKEPHYQSASILISLLFINLPVFPRNPVILICIVIVLTASVFSMVDRIHDVQAVRWDGGGRDNSTKVCENCEKSLLSCDVNVRF